MTTISRSASATADMMPPQRIVINHANDVTVFRPVKLTAEQTAEVARAKANSAAVEAASEKQLRQVEKSKHVESHEMYLPNISDLSLEGAKKSLGIAQVMIDSKEDVGVNVNGRYGDKDISDLNTYKEALTDYISKYETAVSKASVGESTAPSQASTAAASIYRQMQGMVIKDGNEG